ncbi:MAG: hypothetical protein ACRD6W_12295 [Nitrososphaerales archaeon]
MVSRDVPPDEELEELVEVDVMLLVEDEEELLPIEEELDVVVPTIATGLDVVNATGQTVTPLQPEEVE